MSEIETMLEHVLNCFSTSRGIPTCKDTPMNGQISVGTFNKGRTLLKEAKEVRELHERSSREQALAVRAYYED